MSKLFFDHLLEFKKIDREIKRVSKSTEERDELWGLVDEIIHHKVNIIDKEIRTLAKRSSLIN